MKFEIIAFVWFSLIYSTVDANWKIIDGARTAMHEFPQIVSITQDGEHVCGGTLLNGDTVLTAAHCVWEMRYWTKEWLEYHQVKVVLGEHNVNKLEGTEKIYQVTKSIMHPTYKREKAYIDGNDVALIKFDGFISNNDVEFIKYVKLDTDSISKPGDRCEVVGWGSMLPEGEDIAEYLQKADLNIVSTEECAKTYRNVQFVPSNICAGSGRLSRSACKGDSGGPLFCKNSYGERIQVGIVSYSHSPCGQINKPTVYTRVSEVVKWIAMNA